MLHLSLRSPCPAVSGWLTTVCQSLRFSAWFLSYRRQSEEMFNPRVATLPSLTAWQMCVFLPCTHFLRELFPVLILNHGIPGSLKIKWLQIKQIAPQKNEAHFFWILLYFFSLGQSLCVLRDSLVVPSLLWSSHVYEKNKGQWITRKYEELCCGKTGIITFVRLCLVSLIWKPWRVSFHAVLSLREQRSSSAVEA